MTSKRKLSHPALEVAAMLAVQFATPSCGIRYGKGAEQSAQWFPPQVLRSIRRCISALMSRTEAMVFIVAPRRNECVPLVGLTANCVIGCAGPCQIAPSSSGALFFTLLTAFRACAAAARHPWWALVQRSHNPANATG